MQHHNKYKLLIKKPEKLNKKTESQAQDQSDAHKITGTEPIWCTKDHRYRTNLVSTGSQVQNQSGVHRITGTEPIWWTQDHR